MSIIIRSLLYLKSIIGNVTIAKNAPEINTEAIKTYLSQQTDVVLAYLFGSVGRGEAGHLSDVDIAILLDPNLSERESVERQLDLLLALEDYSDREVQVTILNRAAPVLAFQVISDSILLYERDRLERINFQVLTMKRYADVKPMNDIFNRELMRKISEVGLVKQKQSGSRMLEAAQRIHERSKRFRVLSSNIHHRHFPLQIR